MKKNIMVVSVILMAVSMFFTACDNDDGDTKQPVTDLLVAEVTTAPVIDGDGSDAVWDNATELLLTLGQSAEYSSSYGEVDLSLRAVRTDTDLYIRAEWIDPSGTYSVDKKLWSYTDGSWTQSGDEDRLFFLFDAGNNGTEGADCSTMCHVGEGAMYTTGGGNVDVWHIKAARTLPVGCADDKWWDGTGRNSDSKTVGAYADNKASDLPLYKGPVTDGHFLIVPAGQDAASVLEPFDPTDTSATIPGYILYEDRDGSRFADVEARASFTNGTWVVEMKRALDTGNDDDVAFGAAAGLSVQMTVAITDDSGGDHSGSAPFYIIF